RRKAFNDHREEFPPETDLEAYTELSTISYERADIVYRYKDTSTRTDIWCCYVEKIGDLYLDLFTSYIEHDGKLLITSFYRPGRKFVEKQINRLEGLKTAPGLFIARRKTKNNKKEFVGEGSDSEKQIEEESPLEQAKRVIREDIDKRNGKSGGGENKKESLTGVKTAVNLDVSGSGAEQVTSSLVSDKITRARELSKENIRKGKRGANEIKPPESEWTPTTPNAYPSAYSNISPRYREVNPEIAGAGVETYELLDRGLDSRIPQLTPKNNLIPGDPVTGGGETSSPKPGSAPHTSHTYRDPETRYVMNSSMNNEPENGKPGYSIKATDRDPKAEKLKEITERSFQSTSSLYKQHPYLKRFFVKNLRKDVDLRRGCIVDVGGGSGEYFIELLRTLKYRGQAQLIDLSAHAVKLAEKNIEQSKLKINVVKGDIEHLSDNLDVEPGTVDAVTGLNVFDYLPGPKSILNTFKEINKILKPNGKAVLIVSQPNSKARRGRNKQLWVLKSNQRLIDASVKTINAKDKNKREKQRLEFNKLGSEFGRLVNQHTSKGELTADDLLITQRIYATLSEYLKGSENKTESLKHMENVIQINEDNIIALTALIKNTSTPEKWVGMLKEAGFTVKTEPLGYTKGGKPFFLGIVATKKPPHNTEKSLKEGTASKEPAAKESALTQAINGKGEEVGGMGSVTGVKKADNLDESGSGTKHVTNPASDSTTNTKVEEAREKIREKLDSSLDSGKEKVDATLGSGPMGP
ncbi:MAG: class I SAM-dependent methyltransferase, partial [Candidatus Altiarchaeales archaeon]|nr:class I SAM-dependent methyltransferase [Candidatus Altiarchaeales archaeon]